MMAASTQIERDELSDLTRSIGIYSYDADTDHCLQVIEACKRLARHSAAYQKSLLDREKEKQKSSKEKVLPQNCPCANDSESRSTVKQVNS